MTVQDATQPLRAGRDALCLDRTPLTIVQRFHSNLLTKALIVTTPPDKPALSADELANLIKEYVLGQDVAIDAFAAQFTQRRTTHPADRPLGVFLIAGPDKVGRDAIYHRLSSEAHVKAGRGNLFGRDANADKMLRLSEPTDAPGTLADLYKADPRSIARLDNIDKAHPDIIARLQRAWSTGVLRSAEGEAISIAGATFLVATELASDAIAELARRESDPDRLHIEGLKILLDAGFPASLLTRIDWVVCLRDVTLDDHLRSVYRGIAEAVAPHGLELEAGGVDARILIEFMAPLLGGRATAGRVTDEALAACLAEARAQGMTRVRLIQGESGVLVVPAMTPVTGA